MKSLKGFLSRQSYYIKMVFFYSVFTMIIVISSSYILINYSNNTLENEINKSNKRLLAQVKILSDSYMLDRLNSLMNDKFITLSRDRDIYDFFSYNYEVKNELLLRLLSNINNMALNFDYIHSIYFYRKADDILVSSREGVIFSALSSGNTYKSYINTKLIKDTLAFDISQKWISPLENAEFSKIPPIMSFVQPIPMFTSKEERTGCVIININQEDFFKSIDKISDSDTGDLMIIDSAGRMFANTDKSKLSIPLEQTNEIKAIIQNDEGFLAADIDKLRMGISWIKSSVNDWKYVSLVSVEELNKKAFLARQFMIIVAVLIAFFGLAGLNLITSFLYKPFKEFIRTSKEKFNIKNVSNEFSLINSIISNLSIKVEEMEDTIAENQDLIQYKLAIDILYGNIKSEVELKSRLRLSDKEFPYDHLHIVITEIDQKIFMQLNPEQREYISFKLIDLLNSYFLNKYQCISINIPSNCIATIINLPALTGNLQLDMEHLLQLISEELSFNCNIAVSKRIESILSIGNTYQDTLQFLKYGFIYGHGNVFMSSEIEKFEAKNGEFSLDSLKHLETLLKSNKYQQLEQSIDSIIENIKLNGYSYNYTQTVVLQIVGLICKAIREQSLENNSNDSNDITNEFQKIYTLNESIEWIHNLIELYSQNIHTRNILIDNEFFKKITDYITENIDKQISLNAVADVFNISTGHLSRLFKEVTGINFSDYVIDLKFKKAAELLVKSRLEVSEISEKLGYFNSSYFSKLFKEKFGMTPLQFRKKNI